jgi:LPXTG-site transpeptidase (sortase) family protein
VKLSDSGNDLRGRGFVLLTILALGLLASCSSAAERSVETDSSTPVSSGAEMLETSSSPVPITEPVPTVTPEPTPEPVVVNVAGVVVPPAGAPAASGYRIEIARLGINLPVAEGDVPRDVDRAQTPENYAFHLPGTSMFGAGNTYIYAHARVGMFLNLWNARVGDVVIVRTPNGPREYLVEEIHPRVPPTDTSWAGQTKDTRLTLQTSTGPYGTDPRFVVVARPR